jgi:hypothetical protein
MYMGDLTFYINLCISGLALGFYSFPRETIHNIIDYKSIPGYSESEKLTAKLEV